MRLSDLLVNTDKLETLIVFLFVFAWTMWLHIWLAYRSGRSWLGRKLET